MDFIEAVKTEIKRQGIKQDVVASRMGMKPEAFRSSLARKQQPRPEKAVAYAKALGVSVEYLVTGADPADLPADFLRDCRLLHECGALEPVQELAEFRAKKLRDKAEEEAKNVGTSAS